MRRKRRAWCGVLPLVVSFSAPMVAIAAVSSGFRATDLDVQGDILALRTGDADGDGRIDLCVLSEARRTEEVTKTLEKDGQYVLTVESVTVRERRIHLSLQTADGTFRSRTLPRPVDARALGIDLADVDSDGKADLLVLMPNGVDALPLDADDATPRRLVSCRSIFTGSTGFPADLPLARDLDGDGQVELCVPAVGELDVYWGAKGTFADEPARVPRPPLSREAEGGRLVYTETLPTFMDANGDGKLDVVTLTPWGDLTAYLQKRRGQFTQEPLRTHIDAKGRGFERRFVTATDVTGDGLLDVIGIRTLRGAGGEEDEEGGREHPSLEIFAGTPAIPSEPTTTIDLGVAEKNETLAFCQVADVDGDGARELLPVFMRVGTFQMVKALVASTITISLRAPLFRRDARGAYAAAGFIGSEASISFKRLSGSYLLSLDGDLDGDGVKDLLVPKGSEALQAYRGVKGKAFESKPFLTLPAGAAEDLVGSLVILDLDHDGRDDVIVVRESFRKDRIALRVLVSVPVQGTAR